MAAGFPAALFFAPLTCGVMADLTFDPASRELRTRRLLLRPLRDGDAPALFEIYRHPAVTQHYDLDTMDSLEQAQRMLEFFLQHHDRFAVFEADGSTLLGTCGLFHWERASRMVSLGYDLSPQAWGRGIMREAARAVLAYGFAELKLNRVNALSAVDNPASARLLLALGFTEEAVLRQFAWWKGEFHDMRMFALLRDELAGNPLETLLPAFDTSA